MEWYFMLNYCLGYYFNLYGFFVNKLKFYINICLYRWVWYYICLLLICLNRDWWNLISRKCVKFICKYYYGIIDNFINKICKIFGYFFFLI